MVIKYPKNFWNNIRYASNILKSDLNSTSKLYINDSSKLVSQMHNVIKQRNIEKNNQKKPMELNK